MADLPLLPGYSFQNYLNQDHKLKQKLNYSNAGRIVSDSSVGTGRRPVDSKSSAYAQESPNEVIYDPSLTYGRSKGYAYRQVIPHYVLYAQKCLNFKAFFRQSVPNSPAEYHRIRHVNIIYFLEDDTMSVMEPAVDNAGFKQGRLVRRGKIPKINGEFYHWKDLNIGIDLAIYGIVYHTVDCDTFTEEFMRSQGIDLGEKETPPPDSYTQERVAKENASRAALSATRRTRPGVEDPRRRFLEFDGMVLTFDATWNDDRYQVLYFLTDDTIAVREIQVTNYGKDPSRLLLKRMKVPKNWSDVPNSFPSIYMERYDNNNGDFYSPSDLKVGETIFIFGRKFYFYDCDNFTRKYYSEMLNIQQPARVSAGIDNDDYYYNNSEARKRLQRQIKENNKEDVIRKIFNHPKKLRYLVSMIAVHPEDKDREFVLEYSLSDGKIKITEIDKRNSGHRGGCFLAAMLVPKSKIYRADTDNDQVVYYTPEDFFIGAEINIFNHRFVITGADLFVLKYVEANRDKFPTYVVDNIKNYFDNQATSGDELIRESALDKMEDLHLQEPIHSTKLADPPQAQRIIENLQSNSGGDSENRPGSTRQISWADQVPVLCNN
ncbi:EF-hand domain-containing protein 1-like [Cotesia glomerata]|uniref:EF-hand domain-containing protein 1-like n=1 Tax=Cotesia glomerata TaxID=32391 RepID=UPI001D024D92|nr:EF-hand domain-containing protein 1-like [Cotesia glomerata]